MRLTSYLLSAALLTFLVAPAQLSQSLDGQLDVSYGVSGIAYAPGGPFHLGGGSIHTSEGPMYHTTTVRTTFSGPLGITVSKQMGDGTPDGSFGQDGAVQIAFSIDTYAADLALQPDGKIVISAYQRDWLSNSGYDYVLVRLLPDGGLDPDFGDGGILIIDLAPGGYEGISNDFPGSIVFQPDGNIIVGGISDRYLQGAVRTTSYAMLIRISPEGQIDTSFGQGGTSAVVIGSNPIHYIGYGLHLKAAHDGKLLAGATVNVSTGSTRGTYAPHALVMRFEQDGMPDATFSDDGIIDISLASSPGYPTYFNGLTELPDGKIFVLSSDGLAKLKKTGTFDTRFGFGGRVAVGTNWYRSDMAITDDDRIVVSGSTIQPLVATGVRWVGQVRRFWPDGSVDHEFGMGGTTTVELPGQDVLFGRVSMLHGRFLMVTGTLHDPGNSKVFTARFFATP